jgi:hypothetical protein
MSRDEENDRGSNRTWSEKFAGTDAASEAN